MHLAGPQGRVGAWGSGQAGRDAPPGMLPATQDRASRVFGAPVRVLVELGVVLSRAHTWVTASPCCIKQIPKCCLSLLSSNISFSCVSVAQKDGSVWFKARIVQRKASFAVSWLSGVDRSCREDIQKAE